LFLPRHHVAWVEALEPCLGLRQTPPLGDPRPAHLSVNGCVGRRSLVALRAFEFQQNAVETFVGDVHEPSVAPPLTHPIHKLPASPPDFAAVVHTTARARGVATSTDRSASPTGAQRRCRGSRSAPTSHPRGPAAVDPPARKRYLREVSRLDLHASFFGGPGFTLYHAWGRNSSLPFNPHFHDEY